MTLFEVPAEQPTDRGAVLSDDEVYRFHLWRILADQGARVAVIGLNPSTADALLDDATIRTLRGIGAHNGWGRLDMLNLFALRSRFPDALAAHPDPVGNPRNDDTLVEVCTSADVVIAAWGVDARGRQRAVDVADLLVEVVGKPVHALRLSKKGVPEHPLYKPYETVPFIWRE